MARRLQTTGRVTGIRKGPVAALSSWFAAIRNLLRPEQPPRPYRRREPAAEPPDPATRHAIDRVEKIFLRDFKWFFRRMPQPSTGIDARVEILDEGKPTGRCMALQVRSGTSCTREEGGYLHQGKKANLNYWTKHALPVYVVVVPSEDLRIVWQRIEQPFCRETQAEWSIAVPDTNVLDASARLRFEEGVPADPESIMRSIFALDRPLMEELQDRTAFFLWDEWLNPPSIFGNLRIVIGDDPEETPDVELDYHFHGDSLHDIMTTLFPWVSYSYAAPISEYSDAIAVHVLEAELRPEAYAYIEAENFLEAGYPQEEEPLIPDPEDFMTAEEEREFWRSRGTSRSPQDRQD